MSQATLGVNGTMNLQFTHVPTGRKVEFPAFLENLSDQYQSHWNAQDVYGRMDPIVNFINTRRSFSVSWNVPASSYADAKENLRKINQLLGFLYPLYASGAGGATAINQAPLMRVKFGNIIQNPLGGGLLGYLNGFTFDPRVENGMFHHKGTKGMEYYPKTVLLNFEMNVLHEHELGFEKVTNEKGETTSYTYRNKKVNNTNFPYFVSKTTADDRLDSSRLLEVKGLDGRTRINKIGPPAAKDPEGPARSLIPYRGVKK